MIVEFTIPPDFEVKLDFDKARRTITLVPRFYKPASMKTVAYVEVADDARKSVRRSVLAVSGKHGRLVRTSCDSTVDSMFDSSNVGESEEAVS